MTARRTTTTAATSQPDKIPDHTRGKESSGTKAMDPNRPNAARIFDALFGGKDAYELDHHIAEKLLANNAFRLAVIESRSCMLRAVEHLVGNHGVTQIVELGCGYPRSPAVHQVARNQHPGARTLYVVDNDPVVASFARALLVGPNSEVVQTDLTDTASTAKHIAAVMDTSMPIAVCLSGIAELLPEAPTLVASLSRQLPAGTWLVFTHITNDICGPDITLAVETFGEPGIGFYPRNRGDVETMLAPWHLVEPGLVTADQWRPDRMTDQPEQFPQAWKMPPVPSYAAVGQLHQ